MFWVILVSICANKLISIYKQLTANIFHLVLYYKL